MSASQKELENSFVKTIDGKTFIKKEAFQSFHYAAPVLWELIKHFGFNIEQCEEIIQSIHSQSGKKFLTASSQLIIDRESLIISTYQNSWERTEIQAGQIQAILGPWNLHIKDCEPVIKTNRSEAILDVDRLHFPLRWRKWKAGDSFCPLGMEHHKKISDFLIDQKISVAEKDSVTVLESNGEIVWVAGHRVDNRFKITEHTKRAIAFQISLSS